MAPVSLVTRHSSLITRLRLNLRLMLEGAIISYRALFRWLQPSMYLASKVFMPVTYMLFFTFIGVYATGWQNAGFYVIGNAVQMAAISGIFGVTMSIGGDRWAGTLPYLFGTPANRFVMFAGRALMHILDGMLGVGIALIWGALLLGLNLSQTDPLAFGLTILITTFSTSGMGLLLGCLSLTVVEVFFINNLVFFLMMVFSGANIPLEILPGWMQTISQAMPLTRGIAASRQLVAGGRLSDVAPLLVGELLVGLVYLLIGYSLFRWFEFQAKRRGTLEAF
ncbi:MAG TPA: ABC transporter permease [Anaerolineae bacterium]|nr:ABC transporter permease [Anaerolineae bacterium]